MEKQITSSGMGITHKVENYNIEFRVFHQKMEVATESFKGCDERVTELKVKMLPHIEEITRLGRTDLKHESVKQVFKGHKDNIESLKSAIEYERDYTENNFIDSLNGYRNVGYEKIYDHNGIHIKHMNSNGILQSEPVAIYLGISNVGWGINPHSFGGVE